MRGNSLATFTLTRDVLRWLMPTGRTPMEEWALSMGVVGVKEHADGTFTIPPQSVSIGVVYEEIPKKL